MTAFLPSDKFQVLLVDTNGEPYTLTGISGLGTFRPSDKARVVLVDEEGVPYKATGGGGGGTVNWESPQGMRLSAQNNTYVPTTDQIAVGTIYWTPVLSGGEGVVTGFDGSELARKIVTQKSLALTVTSGKNYDVFYDYDGNVLALSAAWSDDITRVDAFANEDGAIVLGSDHTKLWLGTIRASGSNVIEDSEGKRFVCNFYNQQVRLGAKSDTNSHTYNSATTRAYDNDSANKIEVVLSAPEDVTTALSVSIVPAIGGTPLVRGILDWSGSGSGDGFNEIFVGMRDPAPGSQTLFMNNAALRAIPLGYHHIDMTEEDTNAIASTFLAAQIYAGWRI